MLHHFLVVDDRIWDQTLRKGERWTRSECIWMSMLSSNYQWFVVDFKEHIPFDKFFQCDKVDFRHFFISRTQNRLPAIALRDGCYWFWYAFTMIRERLDIGFYTYFFLSMKKKTNVIHLIGALLCTANTSYGPQHWYWFHCCCVLLWVFLFFFSFFVCAFFTLHAISTNIWHGTLA